MYQIVQFEVYVGKISALKLTKTRQLLITKHGTPIMDHPVFSDQSDYF